MQEDASKTIDLLPFDYSGQVRLLPWIMAAMMYLGALSLAAFFATHSALQSWHQDVRGTVIIQVMVNAENDTEKRVKKIVETLTQTQFVTEFTVVEEEDSIKLLEPWFGGKELVGDLPIPKLIDVKYEGDKAGLQPLFDRINEIPDVLITDHQPWLEDLAVFARTVQAIAFWSFLVIMGVGGLTVILSTRAGLSINQDIISMLYLMGAEDEYISKQVEGYTLRHSLTGGVSGVLTAVMTILFLDYFSPQVNDFFLPTLQLNFYHWIVLAVLPFVGLAIAIFTARLSILYRLISEDPYR